MAREDVTPDDAKKMLKALKKSGLRDATIAATLDVARGLLGKQACADVKYRIRDRREMKCVTLHEGDEGTGLTVAGSSVPGAQRHPERASPLSVQGLDDFPARKHR